MRSGFILLICLLTSTLLQAQVISGKVCDAGSGNPLEYVSIGVINTTAGTITNELGKFSFETKGLSPDATVRFSMIGFKSQAFPIRELTGKENIIRLIGEPVMLKEVVIKPSGRFRKIGTTSYTFHGGLAGWGGTDFGKGHEIGTKIDLGKLPVIIKSLHIRLSKQSFDSSLFRLHIRDLKDNMPDHELLNKNIIISLTKESGWEDIDLGKYNLVYSGEIALTLEWVKVKGLNKNKMMKMNGSKIYSANVLLTIKKNEGCSYTRWGTEAKWNFDGKESPSFYVIIEE